MNYYDWEKAVPAEIKGDSLWKIEAYRKMDFTHEKAAINQEELEHLLKNVPLPSL